MPPVTELIEHRNQRKKAAVVFVHGFTGKPEDTWADFAAFLAAEKVIDGWDLFSVGYSTNLRIDLAGIWSADPDLDMVATLLDTTTSLQPLDHYGALAIIAHSMGGLAVQRALLDYADLGARPKCHPFRNAERWTHQSWTPLASEAAATRHGQGRQVRHQAPKGLVGAIRFAYAISIHCGCRGERRICPVRIVARRTEALTWQKKARNCRSY